MALFPGARVGSYEVIALLGAGGMGEVYRARDTTLHRDVALKVLPAALATDAERLARFRREAEALAALNHPGIAQIYGLETAGTQLAIVMELVEGDDLSVRIARGPLAVDETLAIVRQIAAALDAAHERGIVHRDLKPANLKITDAGVVKILDFGLAKAVGPDAVSGTRGVTESPTLTARATAIGVILGTAAYMAPEQAKGRAVDRRADIWAFGAVLFEMLSGRRAFDGEDVSEVLAAVIKTEPPWDALPPNVPPAVSRLVRRCLEKDPRRRLRDISEGMLQLDEGLAQPGPTAAPAPSRTFWRRILPIAAAVIVTAATVWSISGALGPTRPASGAMRISMTATQLVLSPNPRPHIAISPDGKIIYRGRGNSLFIKHADAYDGVAINGSANGTTPFVSPDGQWLGFVQSGPPDNRLFKVPIQGGPRTPIAASPANIYGADWGPDGTIVFGTPQGLFKVLPRTDKPVPLTTATAASDEWHSWPSFAGATGLVLFSIGRGRVGANAKLAAVPIAGGQVTELGLSGTSPRYLATGHIVFATSDGALRAAPFDAARISVTGDAVPIETGVRVFGGSGGADFDLSDTRTLVYVSADDEQRVPVWVNRKGNESPIAADPGGYNHPRLSRDGQRLVLGTAGAEQDLWIWEFARPRLRPFVRNLGTLTEAVWSPDGTAVLFPFARDRQTIQRLNADGSGQPTQVGDSNQLLVPYAVVPGGTAMIVRNGTDVALLHTGNPPRLEMLIKDAGNATLSPDGSWLAYESRKSVREVHVRPFPGVNGGGWQVSSANGSGPLWSRDGTELFYVQGKSDADAASGGDMMSVRVDKGASFSHQVAEVLFPVNAYFAFGFGRHYDVAPDGRFIMLKRIERSEPVIRIVFNWFDEVAARARPR